MAEKKWNDATSNWEVDRTPVTYRVTWKDIDSGLEHIREFTDVDQGYSFYQDMQRTAGALRVTWEHLPW